MKRALAMAALLALSGCADTRTRAYTDPIVSLPSLERVVVGFQMPVSMEFEDAFIDALCSKVAAEYCVSRLAFLPPTREYSNEQVKQIYSDAGITAIVVVLPGSDNVSSTLIGATSSGNVYDVGNVTHASAVTVPIYSFSRDQRYFVDVWTTGSNQAMAMRIDASTSAQGMLNTGDAVFAKSLALEVAEILTK